MAEAEGLEGPELQKVFTIEVKPLRKTLEPNSHGRQRRTINADENHQHQPTDNFNPLRRLLRNPL